MSAKQEAEKSKVTLDVRRNKIKEAAAFKIHLDLHGESKASEIIDFLLKELEAAEREANKLALDLWRLHYQNESPDFELCDSIAGVISQIDNMSAGISGKLEATERKLAVIDELNLQWVHDVFAGYIRGKDTSIGVDNAMVKLKESITDYEASKGEL